MKRGRPPKPTTCENCGASHHAGEMRSKNGQMLCPSCRKQEPATSSRKMETCEGCGRSVPKSQMHVKGGRSLCPSCRKQEPATSNLKMETCEDCGRSVPKSQMRVSHGAAVCPSCFDARRKSSPAPRRYRWETDEEYQRRVAEATQ